MTQKTKYRRSAQVDTSNVGDRVVLYDRDAEKALVLNPTGAAIWNTMTSARSLDELVQWLVAEFPSVAIDEATLDVEKYLAELMDQGVIAADG